MGVRVRTNRIGAATRHMGTSSIASDANTWRQNTLCPDEQLRNLGLGFGPTRLPLRSGRSSDQKAMAAPAQTFRRTGHEGGCPSRVSGISPRCLPNQCIRPWRQDGPASRSRRGGFPGTHRIFFTWFVGDFSLGWEETHRSDAENLTYAWRCSHLGR